MTRGTAYLITDKQIVSTQEFNGDMYPDGHGEEMIKRLEKVKTTTDFKSTIKKFNENNHNYKDCKLIFTEPKSKYANKNVVVMTDENYFNLFFSDWTFWKNISKEIIIIKTTDKKAIELTPGSQVAINFGRFDRNYKSLKECKKLIKEENKVHSL